MAMAHIGFQFKVRAHIGSVFLQVTAHLGFKWQGHWHFLASKRVYNRVRFLVEADEPEKLNW